MSSDKYKENIKVVVRCHPLNEKEIKCGHERIVDMTVDRGLIEVRNPNGSPPEAVKSFTFDSIYDWNSNHQDVYDETLQDLVLSVVEGFNGTIIAYGQTGAGKTSTLRRLKGLKSDPKQKGVVANAVDDIFHQISRSRNQQYLVYVSYLEIYQEVVRDLLSKDPHKKLELKQFPDLLIAYVKDLLSYVVKNTKDMERLIELGDLNRVRGITDRSTSTSTSILTITVECCSVKEDGENHITVGKLNIVDLVGSERLRKPYFQGERLKEARKIGMSLTPLSTVISALSDDKSNFIPYRDSKLTRLLQDSLGGNAKTIIVGHIFPASNNYDETISTLRFVNRASKIKNKPKINVDPKNSLLRTFHEEIVRLKTEFRMGPMEVNNLEQRNEADEILNESESLDKSGHENQEDEESFINGQMDQLEQERQSIINNKAMNSEEKEKLLQEIKDKEEDLQYEKEIQEALDVKIKAIESKILRGIQNIDNSSK